MGACEITDGVQIKGEIMYNIQPTTCKTYFIDLPLSRLHIMEAGTGEPLIIVPATISELENWRSLAQFMAQWFRVYFFELPGHGQSEPFKENFSSHQVAELVKQLVDTTGYDHFNLMGFSFGGILAMRTFKLLAPRIDRLILIAPCLGQRALSFSSLRLKLLLKFNHLLSRPKAQARFVRLIHNDRRFPDGKSSQKFESLKTRSFKKKLPRTKAGTISLNAQVRRS
jgi:pimeloyl-ACP methyl ester carboxylesterase